MSWLTTDPIYRSPPLPGMGSAGIIGGIIGGLIQPITNIYAINKQGKLAKSELHQRQREAVLQAKQFEEQQQFAREQLEAQERLNRSQQSASLQQLAISKQYTAQYAPYLLAGMAMFALVAGGIVVLKKL